MVRVTIGDVSRQDGNIEESWINQQINRRLQDGMPVCVKVQIYKQDIDMGLSTPSCTVSGGGNRLPNPLEQKITELWKKHKLNTTEFRGGNLIAFLKQADII